MAFGPAAFPATIASNGILNQAFNIDFPTFGTTRGFYVEIVSLLGGPVHLQLGTIDGATMLPASWIQQAHKAFVSTAVPRSWQRPNFEWDYTTQQVQLNVINLNSVSDTFTITVRSDDT